ncbi:hypothetical protein ABK040_001151 [Willaertia magna]
MQTSLLKGILQKGTLLNRNLIVDGINANSLLLNSKFCFNNTIINSSYLNNTTVRHFHSNLLLNDKNINNTDSNKSNKLTKKKELNKREEEIDILSKVFKRTDKNHNKNTFFKQKQQKSSHHPFKKDFNNRKGDKSSHPFHKKENQLFKRKERKDDISFKNRKERTLDDEEYMSTITKKREEKRNKKKMFDEKDEANEIIEEVFNPEIKKIKFNNNSTNDNVSNEKKKFSFTDYQKEYKEKKLKEKEERIRLNNSKPKTSEKKRKDKKEVNKEVEFNEEEEEDFDVFSKAKVRKESPVMDNNKKEKKGQHKTMVDKKDFKSKNKIDYKIKGEGYSKGEKNRKNSNESKDFRKEKFNSNTNSKLTEKKTFTEEEKTKAFQKIIFELRYQLKKKNLESCLDLYLNEAPRYLVHIPLKETNELLNLVAGIGRFDKAYEIYTGMFKKKEMSSDNNDEVNLNNNSLFVVKPDQTTIENLLYAAKQSRDLSTIDLLNSLRDIIFNDLKILNIELNSKMFNDLIGFIVYTLKNKGDSENDDVRDLLINSKENVKKFTPNTLIELYNQVKHKTKFVHTLMVQYLQIVGKVDHIFVIYDTLKKEGGEMLDTTFYNTILSTIYINRLNSYDDVLFMFEVYREMIEVGGCQPTCHTFNILFSALKLANQKKLFENSIEYNQRVYGVYKEMKFRLNPIEIDSPLLNLASQLLCFIGKLQEAKEIVQTQPLNAKPLTIQFLLTKIVMSPDCNSVADFKANVEPLLASLVDRAYPLKSDFLNNLVKRMIDATKNATLSV